MLLQNAFYPLCKGHSVGESQKQTFYRKGHQNFYHRWRKFLILCPEKSERVPIKYKKELKRSNVIVEA